MSTGPEITIHPPAAPDPILLHRPGDRIEIGVASDPEYRRRYSDTVEVRSHDDGSMGWRVESAKMRPNHSDLDRILAGRHVPTDVIAATVERVLALLASEDVAWAAYEAAATEAERTSDVVLDVHQNETNVWWVADVTWAATGRDVPRDADEGGTLPSYGLAAQEGHDRAARTGRTVIVRD